MRKFRLLICVMATLVIISSCNQPPKVEYIEVDALPVMDIYSAYRVNPYLEKHGKAHETQAKWYVGQAKQLKSTNPNKAIWNIKRAITLYPNARYYGLLAELLYVQNSFRELSDCYELIQNMSTEKGGKQHDFSPLSETDLCDYVVYSFKGSGYYPFQLYSFIESNGYDYKAFREKLSAYEALQTQVNSAEFKSFISSLLSEEELKNLEKSPEVFRFLLAKCNEVNQINESKHSIALFNFNNSTMMDESDNPLEYMCYNFLKERAEATHWCRIEPKDYVVLADSNILLHYVVDTSMTGVTLDRRNIYHVLATFTLQGKPIDYLIAGKQIGDELELFDYSNQTLTVNRYKRVWRFADDYSRYDNEVTNELNMGTVSYSLGTDAKFTRL